MIEPKVYSVTQINRYIRKILENDFILNSMWVKGEISNFKYNSSGHMYFTLKDVNSAISCVMFKGSADYLPFLPENGMFVLICGYISLYEKTGHYQLYAELLEPVGIGALNQAYEQLKNRLSVEGLFDEDYKREICSFPKHIAVITSPTGAAVRDIMQIAKRRNNNVKITVVPVLVQGEQAADQIVEALKMVNKWGEPDTIILGRGGGSIEDLWAFNEEKVARAIFASSIPVISAVGHETDFTIADFVSDMRAPTPSAAAELAVNDRSEFINRLEDLQERLHSSVELKIEFEKNRVQSCLNRPVLKRPFEKINNNQIYIEELQKNLKKELDYKLEKSRLNYFNMLSRLEALSPLAVLKRGYSVVYDNKNNVVATVSKCNINDSIKIVFADGSIDTKVEKVVKADG